MPHHFARIAFTEDVQAAQETYGSQAGMSRFAAADLGNDRLGVDEDDFVADRDGFYLATVGSSGWPYVQYRGGPAGFLHVLDKRTLGWADFRGNRQYISAGNLAGNDRASLFLMDYAGRRRLKFYGRLEVLDASDPQHRELRARLAPDGYRAVVERLVLVHVEAYDWNCPQHITQRFTAGELAPLQAELTRLRAENAELNARLSSGDDRPDHSGHPAMT